MPSSESGREQFSSLMTDARALPHSGEGATYLPALPPLGLEMQEVAQLSIKGLQTILDQVVGGYITPEIGSCNMQQYLQKVFDKFNLHGAHSLGDSLY